MSVCQPQGLIILSREHEFCVTSLKVKYDPIDQWSGWKY